jgi:uncharacterized protein (TIGR00251 family)
MIQLSDHPEGCVLSVRAQPGARRSGIQGEIGGALKVAVSAPPDKGKANEAIVEVLREALSLKNSQLQIIGGFAHRQKKVLIRDFSKAQLEARIAELLDAGDE